VHLSFVFPDRPQRVYWEVTRSCDLACRHCRAEAVAAAHPDELTAAEATSLIAALSGFHDPLPHLVLTGGDPLKRQDLFALIDTARAHGFPVSVAPSATPLLTADALRRMHAAGVEAISLSLDGATEARHDRIRGIDGTYQRTIAAAGVAREIGLPFQVNTLVCEETVDDLPAIRELVAGLGAARWSLFFLVAVGRGQVLQPISAARAEAVLQWLAAFAGVPRPGQPVVSTTEAPHFRRILAERRRDLTASNTPAHASGAATARPAHAAGGIRDGNGILFISHTGDICPSGFLEVPAGNVRGQNVVDVYRQHPLFLALRDPDAFHGRCAPCEFRWTCGGSRARAYAASHDPLGSDPLCTHEPRQPRPVQASALGR